MTIATTREGSDSSLLEVYRRPDARFVEGRGCVLVDEEGKAYLDFTSGIGVTALGHGSPILREAALKALDGGIIHTSNLYRTPPGEALARTLCEVTGMHRVFLCNSGAEAMEGALKFARKRARVGAGWTPETGDPEGFRKTGVVALHGAFHGRLFGSLALTHKAQYRAPFEPLMPGVIFVDPHDREALDRAIDAESVAAVVAEPIQGEGGIRVLPDDLLQDLRRWCTERGVTLILDEIQCGVGRTGDFRAHARAGITPDLLVLAKPLAGGLPIGAILLSEVFEGVLQPGDHGTTFGGGPFTAAVALAVVEEILRPGFLEGVRARGTHLEARLQALQGRHPAFIREVRGRGLMRGVELTFDVAPVVTEAFALGLLLVGAGPRTLRLLPPLVVSEQEIDEGVARLEEALVRVGGRT